jgi:ABC-type dipeptide/oligopeptide/nickel transport system ATPase component
MRGDPVAIVFQDPLSYLNPVMRVGRQIAESVACHAPQLATGPRVKELLELLAARGLRRIYPHGCRRHAPACASHYRLPTQTADRRRATTRST